MQFLGEETVVFDRVTIIIKVVLGSLHFSLFVLCLKVFSELSVVI